MKDLHPLRGNKLPNTCDIPASSTIDQLKATLQSLMDQIS